MVLQSIHKFKSILLKYIWRLTDSLDYASTKRNQNQQNNQTKNTKTTCEKKKRNSEIKNSKNKRNKKERKKGFRITMSRSGISCSRILGNSERARKKPTVRFVGRDKEKDRIYPGNRSQMSASRNTQKCWPYIYCRCI